MLCSMVGSCQFRKTEADNQILRGFGDHNIERQQEKTAIDDEEGE